MTNNMKSEKSLPYFAYGSNLNVQDWREWLKKRCHATELLDLKKVSKAAAKDYRFVYGKESKGRNGGVADIRPALGQIVEGVLYALTPEQWSHMDRKEGAPIHYERVQITVVDEHGFEQQAITYCVTSARAQPFIAPDLTYVHVIANGLAANGLSAVTPWAYSKKVAQGAYSVEGLFVYGSFCLGGSRAHILPENAERVAVEVPGRLIDCGTFPGLVASETSTVKGEFVAIDDLPSLMEKLDAIEGYMPFRSDGGNLFTRHLIALQDKNDVRRLAWTYRYARDPSDFPSIISGDWMAHSGSPSNKTIQMTQAANLWGDGLDAAITHIERLKRWSAHNPEGLSPIYPPSFGGDELTPFFTGAGITISKETLPTDEHFSSREVIVTPYAEQLSTLLYLCRYCFLNIPGGSGFRHAYGLMSEQFAHSDGTLTERTEIALHHAQVLLVRNDPNAEDPIDQYLERLTVPERAAPQNTAILDGDAISKSVSQDAGQRTALLDYVHNIDEDERERTLANIFARRGQPAFRLALLEAYEGRCCVTGCGSTEVLEAAHITPYRGSNSNHPQNGLLLRADIHTLFDLGLLSVDELGQVMLVPSVLDTYGHLKGKTLQKPFNISNCPSPAALHFHRQNTWRGGNLFKSFL